MAAFAAALAEAGPDPLTLAARFGVEVLAAMRRIAALPDAAAGLVICDGSGTLIFRKPASGFAVPRFGAACPLWPLYTALGRPMQPVEAVVAMAGAGGLCHRVIAYGQTRYPVGLRGPELRAAAMLILPAGAAAGGVKIGSTCRICPQAGCPARREPSILAEAG